jgi:hypothetical protein
VAEDTANGETAISPNGAEPALDAAGIEASTNGATAPQAEPARIEVQTDSDS